MILIDFLVDFILNPWFIISLIFWIIVSIMVFLLRNRKKAYYFFFPLLVMFKTKRLNRIITRIGKKYPKFWKIFWTIGIFISFGFTIFAFWFFFVNLINLIIAPSIQNAVTPLIPGVTIDLPIFAYLLLPLLFIVTTHELAHGISASAENVEVKSTGILGAGLFYLVGFGAFVEVDEKELGSKKFSRNTRLRISAAGTYINAITAGFAFLLIMISPLLISPFYANVPKVYQVLPAEEGGFNFGNLTVNDAIIGIKKPNQSDFIILDEYEGITLNSILNNNSGLKVWVGDILNVKIYNIDKNQFNEKEIILGPKYDIGIEYQYINNTALWLTYNKTSELPLNIIITEIDGTKINRTDGITLEHKLTEFNISQIHLTSNLGINYTLSIEVEGVLIGITSTSYFMYKNDLGKFLTNFAPEFLLIELSWLFVISFSITIFNMLPLPIFDGDRIVKELINWMFGEDYSEKREKSDKFSYEMDDEYLELTEYRVINVKNVKLYIEKEKNKEESEEIVLGPANYQLIDKIGDGHKSTIQLSLPENTKLREGMPIVASYEYYHDAKSKKKKIILNLIRSIALVLVAGNFILSFLQFGFNLFWIP